MHEQGRLQLENYELYKIKDHETNINCKIILPTADEPHLKNWHDDYAFGYVNSGWKNTYIYPVRREELDKTGTKEETEESLLDFLLHARQGLQLTASRGHLDIKQEVAIHEDVYKDIRAYFSLVNTIQDADAPWYSLITVSLSSQTRVKNSEQWYLTVMTLLGLLSGIVSLTITVATSCSLQLRSWIAPNYAFSPYFQASLLRFIQSQKYRDDMKSENLLEIEEEEADHDDSMSFAAFGKRLPSGCKTKSGSEIELASFHHDIEDAIEQSFSVGLDGGSVFPK